MIGGIRASLFNLGICGSCSLSSSVVCRNKSLATWSIVRSLRWPIGLNGRLSS